MYIKIQAVNNQVISKSKYLYMKKVSPIIIFFLMAVSTVSIAQNLKIASGNQVKSNSASLASKPNQAFISIHKEKDSPFEIYQDLIQDQMVIRLKNQFDVLRFEIRDEQGKAVTVKGQQDKNEVHADLSSIPNGRYQLIVDRNKEKIFTEFFLNR
jgi:hypothetical protein